MENRHLFRGKRIDNGQWVVGNRVDSPDGRIAISETSGDWKLHECIPTTISQCTGLKDKNGKLIWENDIMEACLDEDFPENITRVIVQWNGSGWATHQAWSTVDEYLDKFDTEHFAVTSNKFDNPELLV